MRPPLPFVAMLLGGALVWAGCGSLFGVGDLPPLGAGDGGAGAEPDGASRGDGGTTGEGGGTRDVSSVDIGSDPRWPLWPMPPDAPPSTNFTVENGPDGAIVTDQATRLSWQDAVATDLKSHDVAATDCDALVYDGHDDWRLPTRMEMVSLADFEPAAFRPHPTTLSGPIDECYWTASITGSQLTTDPYWSVRDGFVRATSTDTCHVRCVRNGPPLGKHDQHPYRLGTTTVLDPATGLLWERTPPTDQFLQWDEADARCKALTLDGRAARLPTVKELLSIVDDERVGPATDPVFGTLSGKMWSATRQRSTQAWTVDFDKGVASWTEDTFHALSRCVAATP